LVLNAVLKLLWWNGPAVLPVSRYVVDPCVYACTIQLFMHALFNYALESFCSTRTGFFFEALVLTTRPYIMDETREMPKIQEEYEH